MEPDFSKYRLEGDNSMYRLPSGLVAPVVTRAGAEHGNTADSGGAIRVSGVSIQHTPATQALVRQGEQRARLPLRPPPPRRGRDRRLRALRPRPHLLRREVRGLPRHGGGRLGLRPAVHAARRVQPFPQQAAGLDDHAHARRTSWSTCPTSPTPTCATGLTGDRADVQVDARSHDGAGDLRDRHRGARAQPGRSRALRRRLHRDHPAVSVAQGLRRRPRRAGRRRGDALGHRRQDAALDAQLLPAPRRHRRRGALRGGAAARRTRLQHPAGTRLPERQAGLRLPRQLRRGGARRRVFEPELTETVADPQDLPSSAQYLGRAATAAR